MISKLTVCITETLQRLIEVDVDEIDCNPIKQVRWQYLEELILWILKMFTNFNSNCAHSGG